MNHSINPRQVILVAEDSDDDFEYTEKALREANLINPIHRAEDGQQVLDYLQDATKPRPGIILMDLNMPGTDGREALIKIKQDESLRMIPVIVFTTSDDEVDIEACYHGGANTYITKPLEIKNFFAAMERLKEYWFEIAILPKGEPSND